MSSDGTTVLLLLALHAAVALAAPLLVSWLGRRALFVLAAVPAAVLVWAASVAGGVLDGDPVRETLSWAPSLGFDVTVRVDGFSLLMLSLVSGIGVLVLCYAAAYLGDRSDLGRLGGLLLAFCGAMTGVVVSDNLLAIFLFWETTSIVSYLLIGIDDRSATARAGALRALLTTGGGGLALLGGVLLLGGAAGTWSLSEILAAPPSGTAVDVALALVLLAAFTKSAQFPFHFWLPGAMIAPTPVSAYLHSATMVKAGVYLIARFSPAFADVGFWRPVTVGVGLTTMLIGAWRALSRNDLKLLLAHGTTSQLGFMVVLFGIGHEDAALAGATLLLAHGLFKAALFMVVGIVDHETGTRDLRRLSGLHRSMPSTTAVAAVSAASMAGLPPLLGFIAKEGAFQGLLHAADGTAGGLVVAGVAAGSVLTFAYSARFVWGMVAGRQGHAALVAADVGADDPGPGLLVPAVVLAAATVVGGVAPALVSPLVVGGARALDAAVPDEPLALWHGFGLPLALSAVVVVAGAGLWAARRPIEEMQSHFSRLPSGARTFDRMLASVLHGADVAIGKVQTGSLPLYLMTILTTVLLVPGTALLLGADQVDVGLALADHPGQLVTVALMAMASLGAVVIRHRLSAVVCVGAVGYGVAVLFMLQGAPDLALTQVLVETLLLVVFVLVMRHLPTRFAPNQTAFSTFPRALISVLVGVFAATFVLVAYAARPDVAPVSDQFVALAPEAGGRNVVNEILVEFRAFDTMGESAVLTVVALGVLGLVRSARRQRDRATARTAAPWRPSFLLDAAVRTLFRTVVLFSLVLLFAGHDKPGGGFIGGLVAGSAFMLVYLAGGEDNLKRFEPLVAEAFLGLGVTLTVLAGAVGWLSGGAFLESDALSGDLPAVGTVKISTTLVFDAGVYLVVLGLVVALLRSFGREEVQEL